MRAEICKETGRQIIHRGVPQGLGCADCGVPFGDFDQTPGAPAWCEECWGRGPAEGGQG